MKLKWAEYRHEYTKYPGWRLVFPGVESQVDEWSLFGAEIGRFPSHTEALAKQSTNPLVYIASHCGFTHFTTAEAAMLAEEKWLGQMADTLNRALNS